MNVDQKLLELAIKTITEVDVEIDFESLGEFVENFAVICNKVFITSGRIHNWQNMNFKSTVNRSIKVGEISYNMNKDTYTLYNKDSETIFTFEGFGDFGDFDEDAGTEADYFSIQNENLNTLKLGDIVSIKMMLIDAIEDIECEFNKINNAMEEIKDALNDVKGIKI